MVGLLSVPGREGRDDATGRGSQSSVGIVW